MAFFGVTARKHLRSILRKSVILIFICIISFSFSEMCWSFEGPASPEGTADYLRESIYSSLLSKVHREGRVRVIVRLNAGFLPEGKRGGSEVYAQRSAIARSREALLEAMAAHNVAGIKQFNYIPFVAMEVDESALSALAFHPEVIGIAEDHLLKPVLRQSVPLIGGDHAWSMGYTGKGWTVAVLDTGVAKDHIFLQGKVVAEACFSSQSGFSIITSLCPNGQTSQIGSGSGKYCPYPLDGCEHGTHVAGIAAGRAQDINGVAKDADIISIQVFSRFDDMNACDNHPPCTNALDSDILRALEHIYGLRTTYNIAAVNLSLAGDASASYCDASSEAYKAIIDNLRAEGIATVIASGNDGEIDKISFPACISSAISVGSTSKHDIVSYFSNSASFLSLLAPGEGILSSVPYEWGTWAEASGTSMAAPHVAGAWAVLKQREPSATVDEVLSALQSTGVPVTDVRNGITKPIIQVDDALTALGTPGTSPVYRFFNTVTTGHFFTINESEKETVIANYPQFRYEGIGFYAYAGQVAGALPVYRFFNTVTSGHFFTLSEDEKNVVIQNYPQFSYEGTGFYAFSSPQSGVSPVYRFFNTVTLGHFFTLSEDEKNAVIQNYPQFSYEGIGFYAFSQSFFTPPPSSNTWSGDFFSFNLSSDGTSITATGSQLEGGHPWILDIPLSGNGCGYPSVTVFGDSTIPIERMSFNVSEITSNGAAVNLSGYFDSQSSAKGSYAYSNVGNGCYGSGFWTASPH